MYSRFACALALALAGAPGVAAAQSSVAVPVHAFRYAGPPAAALARLRHVVARCWSDDYDSRVHGLYREVARLPTAVGAGGATIRLEWIKLRGESPAGLLQRAFDIRLAPENGGTRVTVLVYIPRSDLGRDVEAWLAGREKCFAARYPSP